MKNDGGPVIPRTGVQGSMSLRDWFAGQALALGGDWFHEYGGLPYDTTHIAQIAYDIADAMLKEREK